MNPVFFTATNHFVSVPSTFARPCGPTMQHPGNFFPRFVELPRTLIDGGRSFRSLSLAPSRILTGCCFWADEWSSGASLFPCLVVVCVICVICVICIISVVVTFVVVVIFVVVAVVV